MGLFILISIIKFTNKIISMGNQNVYSEDHFLTPNKIVKPTIDINKNNINL
jgi:hypothetical protein